MEIVNCPNCLIRVMPTKEGCCPGCRRSLIETTQNKTPTSKPESKGTTDAISASPGDGSTGSESDSTNPYRAPTVGSVREGVYRFTELPTQCPSCGWPFNLRFYPRRFQKKAILFLVFATFVALFAGGLVPIPGVSQYVALLVLLSLGGVGMSFPKVVHLKCRACHWSHKFLVRTRG